ncbi:MAG: FKBP-type peptidyl-prolyl cis-trans isomerase [Gammaproteobacteria bacterium]
MSVRLLAVCVTVSITLIACSPQTNESASEANVAQKAAKKADQMVAEAAAPAEKPKQPSFVPRPIKEGVPFTTEGGMTIIAHKLGSGTLATNGHPTTVHYSGWLYDETATDNKGDMFDSSVERGSPFRFTLGVGGVIEGWDQGVLGMKVGGKRTLVIPHEMAYGKRGRPPVIPPASTLVFDVELLGVE